MLFDETYRTFISYQTKNNIYYRTQYRTTNRLNIPQKRLFNKVDEYMECYNFGIEAVNNLEEKFKKKFNINNEIKNEKFLIKDDLEKIEKDKKVLAQKVIQ